MRSTLRLLLVSSFALSLTTPASSSQGAEEVDAIVARVGEVELTREDLKKEYKRLIPANFFHNKVPDGKRMKLLRDAMGSLVEKTLIHQDALRRGIEPSEEEIRVEFEDALSKAGPQFQALDPDRYEELLEQSRPAVLRKLLRDKNEARFEASIAPVDQEALRQRYAEQKGQLLTADVARFGHILFKVSPEASNEEAKAIHDRAEEVLARLEGGESFEDLARESSEDIFAAEGGDMGFVGRDDFLQEPVGEAAFRLKDGETSGVLTSIYGFHIVRRIESRPRLPLTFEQARDILADQLQRENREAARAAWMSELRSLFPVEVLVDLSDIQPVSQDGHGMSQ